MSETKPISTLALGTLASGISLVERFAGVHEAAEWVLGHAVWTHELPDAVDRIREAVAAQRPDFPLEIEGTWQSYRDELLRTYGPTIEIERGHAVRTASPVQTLAVAMQGQGKGR